jgi:hypothetical protein
MISPDLPTQQNKKLYGATTGALSGENNHGTVSATFMKWAIGILFLYFGARLFFFALNISSFVPPDEVTHAGLCKIFSNVFLLPDNTPSTYEFGLVTNIPWLYYWLMGKLLHLNFFGISDLVFLRLLNIPIAFLTVWYVTRLLRLLTENRVTQLLLIVIVTNIPMFSLLSASVSYDNLVNLLAAMAIYYQFAFFKNRTDGLLVASLFCQMAGSLTKITFLPLILVLNLLLVLNEVKNLRNVPKKFRRQLITISRRTCLTAFLFIIAAGLNLQLYAGNYLHYGTINPPMATVLSPEKSMNYRLDARGTIFNLFKDGKISYMDALILTGEIKHPGDKADTFYLLMNYQKMKSNPQLWLSPLQYASFWFQTMTATTFGIKGHLGMFKPTLCLLPLYAVMALAFLGFIVRWRPMEADWIPLSLAIVPLYYSGVLIYEVNYDTYLNYGEPNLTVYGRYLFIVMAPVVVLLCHYLLSLFRYSLIRNTLALLTALLFISYDFPWFLLHATPEWFEWMPK